MQGVVIQGPTNYYKEIIECYKDTPNVVWSTWDDEPSDVIKHIEGFIPVVLNRKPSFPGYLNVNMQTTTTMGGIHYLKEKGITEVLKVRGDVIVNDIGKFLLLLKGKDMSFLAIAKEGVRNDLYYELIYRHYSHDYPTDLVVYGTIDNLEKSFNFYIEDNQPIPPEALVIYHFLVNNGLEYKSTYEHLINNNIHFYLNDCVDNNIELEWLKHDNCLVKMHNNKTDYEF
jgi:hypothetical protein